MKADAAYKLTDMGAWFRYWMPYTFQELSGGVYLPLNRDYKPLGLIQRDHVEYEDFAVTHGVKFARDPRTFTDVWWDAGEPLFLYSDNPRSREDYFIRLDRLMSRSMKITNKPALKAMNRLA